MSGNIIMYFTLIISMNPLNKPFRDFPGVAVVKNPPAKAGDSGSIPGPRRAHRPQSN